MIPDNRPLNINDIDNMTIEEMRKVRIQLLSNTLKTPNEEVILEKLELKIYASD